METRKESDSIGVLDIPKDAYYGVQTLRGYRNFNITGHKMNEKFVLNIVRIKKAAALSNFYANVISEEMKNAIVKATDEILSGKFLSEFITDSIQGGAGTTVNMNANEVIANRATEILGGKKGEYLCHPNDHVNRSQSTNDVVPSAGKLTTIELTKTLLDKINTLTCELDKKAVEFDGVIKMGRTQLQDAVPVRLGQEFSAYSVSIKRCAKNISHALSQMRYLNIGGTAIGTAVNVEKKYLDTIVSNLKEVTGEELFSAENLIDQTQNLDGFTYISGTLKALAVALSKMSNDLRLMSSGPKTGMEEIILPAMQNGSSIMPGKVNPVIPEVVNQVAFSVIGNDMTIAMATEAGQLELNAFEPVIFYKLFESITSLTGAVETLTENCIKGITPNKEHCNELLLSSVGIVTALCPYIGYIKSASLAKEALAKNIPIKELVLSYNLLDKDLLDKILDPIAMTNPKK